MRTSTPKMATNKRVISAVKEKKVSPSHTTKTPLTGTLNQSTKTSVSSPPKKQAVPTSLIKPPTRSTATNASKPQGKKPASPETPQKGSPQKPSVAKTTKTVSPVAKTRIPTNASTRSSSLSGKPVDSQKTVPSKNLKTPSKQGTNASSVKKSSPVIKKEIESPSATKEHIPSIQNVEIPSVVEAEEEAQDQESYIGGEKVDEQKGTDDHLVVEDQEPLDSAKKSEAETDDTDVKVVFSELSTDSVQEDAIPDVKIQDSDDKSSYVQVLEEDDNNNSHEEVIEEDAGEAEKVEKEEEKEIVSGKEAPEFKEPERKEVVVEEKKQEPAENKAPKQAERPHGKKDCALSNDVIEETISKLQERKNRVRALAGAFETVISLQEK